MVAKYLLLGIATIAVAALTLIVMGIMTVQPVLAPRSCGSCSEIAMGHGEEVSDVATSPR